MDEVARVLQVAPDIAAGRLRELEARFDTWYALPLDLPGTFYLQIVQWLFKENRIAEGRFVVRRLLDSRRISQRAEQPVWRLFVLQ